MLWINVVNKFVIPMIIKKNENYLIFKFYIVWRLKLRLRSYSIEKYQHKNKERKI